MGTYGQRVTLLETIEKLATTTETLKNSIQTYLQRNAAGAMRLTVNKLRWQICDILRKYLTK